MILSERSTNYYVMASCSLDLAKYSSQPAPQRKQGVGAGTRARCVVPLSPSWMWHKSNTGEQERIKRRWYLNNSSAWAILFACCRGRSLDGEGRPPASSSSSSSEGWGSVSLSHSRPRSHTRLLWVGGSRRVSPWASPPCHGHGEARGTPQPLHFLRAHDQGITMT